MRDVRLSPGCRVTVLLPAHRGPLGKAVPASSRSGTFLGLVEPTGLTARVRFDGEPAGAAECYPVSWLRKGGAA